MAKHFITEEEYNEVVRLMKQNKNKKADRRMKAIILRYEGKTYKEIGEKLDYTQTWVSKLCKAFKEQGAKEYARNKFGGNNQAVDKETEAAILSRFREEAESGRIVSASEIKKAFDEYRGKDAGRGYIYELLERHKWRTVMPRGKHPKGASAEDIESSKKLTIGTENCW
jgi:transposase